MIQKFFKLVLLIIFCPNILLANNQFFSEGLNLFKIKKFEEAKFKFEQDIVFNPKSEKSYLYLSKIFNKQNKKDLEKKNLNTVILLNPQNEEATLVDEVARDEDADRQAVTGDLELQPITTAPQTPVTGQQTAQQIQTLFPFDTTSAAIAQRRQDRG